MILKTVLTTAFVAVFCIVHAQVDKASFERAVNFVNCKAMQLSLQFDEVKHNKYVAACQCSENVSYDQIFKTLNDIGDLSQSIALSKEIESLKNSYREDMQVEQATRFLTNDIFGDEIRYEKIFSFANKRKGQPEFKSFQRQIIAGVPGFFQAGENINSGNLPSNETDAQVPASEWGQDKGSPEKEQIPEMYGNNNPAMSASRISILNIVIAVVLSLICTFIASRYFKRKPVGISGELHDYIKEKIQEAAFRSAQPFQPSYANDIKTINERIREIELKLNSITSQVELISGKAEGALAKVLPPQNTKPEVKADDFFLSTPNSDGTFNESSASASYKEGASIYRFIKMSDNRATFQIDEREASVKLALQYPNKNIDPVCDAENAYNFRAKRITTVARGEAELVGNKWVNISKAKIRYDG